MRKNRGFWYCLVLVATFVAMRSLMAEDLYQYNGKTFKSADLEPSEIQEIFDIENEAYQRKLHVLEHAMVEVYIKEQAAKDKTTVEIAREKIFKAKAPSEKELKDFYEKHKDKIPPSYQFDMIKPQLVNLIEREKQEETKKELLKKIMANKGNKFLLSEPQAPKVEISTAGFPSKGKEDSKVVVVEFADYQCPHCAHAYESLKKVWSGYEKKVKFVFIDFPINPSGISTAVAEGAFCAGKQGKYWEFHGKAFENQKTLSNESAQQFSKDLKLDAAKFDACMKDAGTKAFVAKAKSEGDRVGVKGTPTIFINGKRLNLTGSFEDSFKQAVDAALKGSV
ncbi:MAG: DsbA family protein [Oligoflexales bacterium]|nr:DsbA family protein [Oligoflexales bacterium]